MYIRPTTFTRSDGVYAREVSSEENLWVLTKIHGPGWFYDAAAKQWVCSCIPGIKVRDYSLPFEEAYALLRTVQKD